MGQRSGGLLQASFAPGETMAEIGMEKQKKTSSSDFTDSQPLTTDEQ
jgi:hypothetical protein